MISREEALYYQEQLHPAFAGYLHDGVISERDVLAVLFTMFITGVLRPVWEDGSMNKKIVAVQVTGEKVRHEFEGYIVSSMLGEKHELSAAEVGAYIRSEIPQEIIKQNLKAIEAFPVVNHELRFTYKGMPIIFSNNEGIIDTPEKAQMYRKELLFKVPLFVGFALLTLSFSIFRFDGGRIGLDFSNIGSHGSDLLISGVLILLAILYFGSKMHVQYDFEKHIVPVAKKKYDELYAFLQANPLQKHTFVNEFLPFAIAFGLDTSWQRDFGLMAEV